MKIDPYRSSYSCHPSILREYDIRGIIDVTLYLEDAFYIGKAFGRYTQQSLALSQGTMVVGWDGRHSSPALANALMEGLSSTGFDVLPLGICPTPFMYFNVHAGPLLSHPISGGVMVTGSHNPPTHNGFKFLCGKAPFYGKQIQALGHMMQEELPVNTYHTPGIGAILSATHAITSKAAYIDILRSAFTTSHPLKVVWDAGNGATGEIIASLCPLLPGEHILLYTDIDGDFPNHHPDPSVPENLAVLVNTVLTKQCDLGVAFDGDGDRIGVVDSKGRIIAGDQLLLLLARDVLSTQPGSTIIADVKASRHVFEGIAAAKGLPIMWKTGHSLIKAKMTETKALLAGEMSGHLFFADRYFGYDDGLYAAVRILDMIAQSSMPFASMVDQLPPTFSTPELRIPCADEHKFAIIDAIKQHLQVTNIPYNDMDGVRVTTQDGWWLLRASNTQAALVARCEANSAPLLSDLKAQLIAMLIACEVVVPSDL